MHKMFKNHSVEVMQKSLEVTNVPKTSNKMLNFHQPNEVKYIGKYNQRRFKERVPQQFSDNGVSEKPDLENGSKNEQDG